MLARVFSNGAAVAEILHPHFDLKPMAPLPRDTSSTTGQLASSVCQ